MCTLASNEYVLARQQRMCTIYIFDHIYLKELKFRFFKGIAVIIAAMLRRPQ
jgi:hypothetical protein